MSFPAGLDEFLAQPTAAAASAPTIASEPAGLNDFIGEELNQQQHGGLGQQAIAGLEGVARGATLGASDLAETKLLGVKPEDIKGRMQANPVTSSLGSIGGGAALIGATGGLGGVAEGVVGAGLGAAALGAGAEGALFGAGSAVSDAALGDPNVNAQKILSDIGMGAALGIGAGAIGHGISSILGKSGSIKGTVADALGDEASSANKAAETARTIENSEGLKSEAPEVIAAAGRLNAPVLTGMVSDNPWVQKAEDALINGAPTYFGRKRANLYAEAYNGVVNAVSDVAPETSLSKAQVGASLQDSLTNQIAQESKPIGELYDAIKQQTQNIPVSEKGSSDTAKSILNIEGIHLSPSSPEYKLASDVASEVINLDTVDDIKAYRKIVSNRTMGNPELKRVGAIISDRLQSLEEGSIEKYALQLRDSTDAAGLSGPSPEQIDSLLQQKKVANAQYKPFIEKIGTLAEKLGKKKVYGPQDAINFISDLTPEQLAQKLFSKNDSQFLEFFSKNYPDQMATMREYQKGVLRDAASKTGTFSPKVFFNKLNDLEPEIQKSIFFPEELQKLKDAETYLRSFPKNYNPSGTSGMNAFREFFHSPTGALVANARDFGIDQFIKAMGALPEGARPSAYQVGADMAAKFNAMNAAKALADRTDKSIVEGIHAIAGNAALPAAITAGDKIAGSFEEKTDRIKELAENQDALSAHVANNVQGISDHLPTVSQSLAGSLTASVTFLNSKIPRPKAQFALSPKWTASNLQKQKFDRYYGAAAHPLGVLKQIKNGTLTGEAMESLKACHPDLLKHMQTQMLSTISPDRARKLPFATRQSLSMFMGAPLEDAMVPAVILANQAAFNPQAQQPQQQQRGHRSTLGGLKELKVAGRVGSHTYDLENPSQD